MSADMASINPKDPSKGAQNIVDKHFGGDKAKASEFAQNYAVVLESSLLASSGEHSNSKEIKTRIKTLNNFNRGIFQSIEQNTAEKA